MRELIESTANLLRGICLDPSVPARAKSAMRSRIRELDAAPETADRSVSRDRFEDWAVSYTLEVLRKADGETYKSWCTQSAWDAVCALTKDE